MWPLSGFSELAASSGHVVTARLVRIEERGEMVNDPEGKGRTAEELVRFVFETDGALKGGTPDTFELASTGYMRDLATGKRVSKLELWDAQIGERYLLFLLPEKSSYDAFVIVHPEGMKHLDPQGRLEPVSSKELRSPTSDVLDGRTIDEVTDLLAKEPTATAPTPPPRQRPD